MSVEIPYVTIGFGSVGVPRADVVECKVHLGCTKEVSSFEVLLQNWNGKYSPGGASAINVGVDGYIKIGRSADPPLVLSCRVESVECESSANEHYLRVCGRCWGERLFRRVYTGAFQYMKGEAIVKYLLDYVGLSHTRGGQELVENTDTTYTYLEFENTPVWDIIKYIAESADKNGVVGFDFRIAPDGKFEFFPRLSKTSPVSLTDKIEVCEYRRDIHRLRNRILVLGEAGKKFPGDYNEDGLTESLSQWYPYYSAHDISLSTSHVAADGEVKYDDQYSVCVNPLGSAVDRDRTGFYRSFDALKCRGQEGFKRLRFWLRWSSSGPSPSSVKVKLHTTGTDYFFREIVGLVGARYEWKKVELSLEDYWAPVGNPSWTHIAYIGFDIVFPSECLPILFVDHVVFEDCRFSAVQEDTASQNQYGLRELTETDEELRSDSECQLRAKALLAHLNGVAEYLTVKSTVLDYGNSPLLPGDKIYVALPNENVSGYFRIETVEYHVDAKTQTLEVTLELDRVPPLLADYLYGLRSTTVTVEKLARTKLGKGAVAPISRAPAAHLHNSLVPDGAETGFLGNDLNYFNEVHGKHLYLYRGVAEPYGQLQLKVQGESSPRVRIGMDVDGFYGLEFGPGGGSAVDTWLRRVGQGEFWLHHTFGPFADAPAIIKFRTRDKLGVTAVNHFLQPTDNRYGCLGSENFHWREMHTQRLIAYENDGLGDIRVKTQGEANPKARLTGESLEFGGGGNNAPDVHLKRSGDNTLEVKAWKLVPNADGVTDLGDKNGGKRWRNIYLTGELGLGDYTVLTSSRVLQNVVADAAIITSGQFPLARLPRGTAGYVLEAQGAGFDPMYVDPNYRYQPASHSHPHNHSGETISPNQVNCNTLNIAVSCNRQYTHPSTQQCVYASSVAWENCPRYYAPAGHTHSCSNAECGTIMDLIFANGFRVTEAEKLGLEDGGLAFLNPQGEVLMVLDGKGNLSLAGKIRRMTVKAFGK